MTGRARDWRGAIMTRGAVIERRDCGKGLHRTENEKEAAT